jgi:hypothetical protein
MLLLVFASTLANAQVTTADLVGTVTDSTGAVLPNASVTVKNTATGISRKTTTDQSGNYAFSLLQIGQYDLLVSAPGFKDFKVAGLSLAVGERRRANAELALGSSTEAIQVTGDATPALQTENATVSSVVPGNEVQNVPLNGRNFINLVQVQPGVNAGQPTSIASGNRPDSRRQTSSFSANGQPDSLNNNLIDGLDNNERVQGFIGVRPTIDSIQEVRVDTNSYSAEMGRAAGAVVNIITKSGTNEFHGSAYEYFRNDILNARDAFDNIPGSKKPELRQNQFGGSIGGPIVHNRTFFFADVEWFRSIQGITYTETVPTAYELSHPGDMSDRCPTVGIPCTGYPIIPDFLLDPVALNYFKLYPTPNRDGFINNYTSARNRTQYATTVDGRLDHMFTPNDLIFVRYAYNPVDTYVQAPFPDVNGVSPGGSLFVFPGPNQETSQNLQASYTHIFTPNLLLKLQAGYTRINIKSLPENYGRDVANQMGLVNANIPGDINTTGLTPMYFALGDYASLGGGVYQPIFDINNTFQYSGSVSYNRGAHSFKMGASLIRRQLNYFQSVYPSGAYIFIPLGLPTLGGSSLPYFLTGTAYQYLRSNVVERPGYRSWEISSYFQDDWRVTSKLTLNLGLRYEIFTPYTEVHNLISNFDPNTLKIITATDSNPTASVNTNYTGFAPRLGFAYSIHPSTVIRGGFGMSYYPTEGLNSNPPAVFNYQKFVTSLSVPAPIPTETDPETFATNPYVNAVSAIPFNLRPLYVEQFNLAVQHQLGPNTFTLAYVGQLGRQMIILADLNRPNAPGANQPALPYVYATQLPFVQQIFNNRNGGVMSYNAMQASYLLQTHSGLNMNINYTWAHTLSNVSFASAGNGLGTSYAPNLLNNDTNYDYGNADTDVRQRVTVVASYQLPFGSHLTGVAGVLGKGWQVNTLAYWQTGLPFTVSNSNGQAHIRGVTGDRPDVIGDPTLSDPSPQHWFNTSAFALQTPGTLGNSGRNTVTGPRDRRWDLSVFKLFTLTDRFRLQFRAECFNVTNTPNWGPVNVNWQLPVGGTISQTAPNEIPRQFQLALKLLF